MNPPNSNNPKFGELTLDELSDYLDKLSFKTISRNPEAPIIFSPLELEQRSQLLIGGVETQQRRRSMRVKGHIKRWCMWTIASPMAERAPRVHVTGQMLDRSDRLCWWTTSEVLAIADDLSCVFTASGSLYEISDERPELPNDGFVHIVTVLNVWGWERLLKLPPLFY